MNINMKKFIPAGIFAALIVASLVISMNPPEAPERRNRTGPSMSVDVVEVLKRDYQVTLESYGIVQPRTQTTLTAQVSGQIVSVNPNVRDGGFFEKGDVLASIDARDFEANVRIAQATLMDARQTLGEAEARSLQASEDWIRLGNEGEAPDLVLRVPQLAAAKARVVSAESNLEKARLDLERTDIVAPYAGRILQKHADLGQVVSSNTPLADIYATDTVEIRLPLRNSDLSVIDLPETYRFAVTARPVRGVKIRSDLIGNSEWDALLVRTEGAIDDAARQLHVIAQIENPFSMSVSGQSPLKIGQYVTAELKGKVLDDVLVIPNSAVYQGSYVYIVEDQILLRRDIEIAWQNDTDAIVVSGLNEGDNLVTTALGQVTSGLTVRVNGAAGQNGWRTSELAGEGRNESEAQ
jgi:RND family efflux transporter MFP subunit